MVKLPSTSSVMLFVPGDRPERFDKAAASTADSVILDLEDSVADDNKVTARLAVSQHEVSTLPVVIRVNGLRSPEFASDMSALSEVPFSAIMLPKTESIDDIKAVHDALNRHVKVIPLIETARGVVNLPEVLRGPGVNQAALGEIDLSVDLGCTGDSALIDYARCQILLHSRVSGILPPLDGVSPVIDDEIVIERLARRAADMGFAGKLAVHPKQIKPLRRGFHATTEQITWARKIVSALPDGATGAIRSPDGEMIDTPVIAKAMRILQDAGISR